MNKKGKIKSILTIEGRVVDLQDYTLDDEDDMFYYFLGEPNENDECKLIMIGKESIVKINRE